MEEVVSKYQGFEGELVCFFEIKDNITEFKEMIGECLKLKELGSCFILHVISSPYFSQECGYDAVGNLISNITDKVEARPLLLTDYPNSLLKIVPDNP